MWITWGLLAALLSGVAVLTYLTARRLRAERARVTAETRYQRLINNLNVGVYRVYPHEQGIFIEVNDGLLHMLKVSSREELLRRPVKDFYADPQDFAHLSQELLDTGAVTDRIVEGVRADGTRFWASLTAVKQTDEKGEIYFDGVIGDVTARKQAEFEIRELNARLADQLTELTAVNKELEAFSYSVSHDLRAPLRSIDGFSRALIEDYYDRLDAQGRDYLERVSDASQRMSRLIDDLLLLSRITRAEMTKTSVDMSAMAREIIDDLRRVDPQRVVDCEIEAGLVVEADARLLRVALTNLLDNAWKFTGKTPAAKITVGRHARENANLYYVADNGAGFNMAYADKLFGVFQRLHNVNEFPGTGVGLAIVQRVVHRHGGKLRVEAAVDRGATFFFTFSPERE